MGTVPGRRKMKMIGYEQMEAWSKGRSVVGAKSSY